MFKNANVGTADRIIRIVLGVLLIAAPYLFPGQTWTSGGIGLGLQIAGAVFVLTGLVRFCPMYRLLGMRTCRT